MDILGSPIWTWLLTTVLGGIIGWVGNAFKKKCSDAKELEETERRERRENRVMIGELLFYRLEDLHRRYVINGEECSPTEKQQVERAYKSYHDVLGLNGAGTQMYREIMNLK